MAPRIPAPFGVAWDRLTLKDVQTFLALAEDESLTWEAKGNDIRPAHVREAASAFGNSLLGGLLLLGVSQDRNTREWSLDGWVPPQSEVELWLNDCLDNGGVTPKPSVAVKPWKLDSGGAVACVAIWPVAVPPVITSAGQVWERTSGKSQKLTEPSALRRLFERGDAARLRVRQLSNEAAEELLTIETNRGLPSIVLGFGAASLPSEMAADVFRQSFLSSLVEDAKALHRKDLSAGIAQLVGADAEWNQGGATFRSNDGFPTSESYSVRVGRDARVALAFSDPGMGAINSPQTYTDRFLAMWEVGIAILRRLGALGTIHVAARLPTRIGVVSMAAWSETESDGKDELAAMIRDAQRALGLSGGWEPEHPSV
jgi:hypothetical protein